jgi:hypothetical protein
MRLLNISMVVRVFINSLRQLRGTLVAHALQSPSHSAWSHEAYVISSCVLLIVDILYIELCSTDASTANANDIAAAVFLCCCAGHV